jgi:hypothetical protein
MEKEKETLEPRRHEDTKVIFLNHQGTKTPIRGFLAREARQGEILGALVSWWFDFPFSSCPSCLRGSSVSFFPRTEAA